MSNGIYNKRFKEQEGKESMTVLCISPADLEGKSTKILEGSGGVYPLLKVTARIASTLASDFCTENMSTPFAVICVPSIGKLYRVTEWVESAVTCLYAACRSENV
jgi:hypothetical protein